MRIMVELMNFNHRCYKCEYPTFGLVDPHALHGADSHGVEPLRRRPRVVALPRFVVLNQTREVRLPRLPRGLPRLRLTHPGTDIPQCLVLIIVNLCFMYN